MQPDNPSSSTIAWPQIIVVLLLATGAFFIQSPIGPDRPLPSGKGVPIGGVQDLEARLWQDPFGVLPKEGSASLLIKTGSREDVRVKGLSLAKGPGPGRDLKWLSQLIGNQKGKVKVMIALVQGGTWVGADEGRRRARYAVLAGLNTQGYVPDDPEHIGYAEETIEHGWRAQLPFEWLSKNSKSGEEDWVLLLWVDEEALAQDVEVNQKRRVEPLARLSRLIKRIQDSSKPKPPVGYIVVGPSSSTFFETALKDSCVEKNSCFDIPQARKVQWYSPYATLPDVELTVKTKADKNRFLTESLPNFHRLIVSDDVLATTLVEELEQRRFGRGNAVALVGQWDTAYGRGLRRLLKDKIGGKKDKNGEEIEVLPVSYLRGVDGRVPGTFENGKEKGSKEQNGGDKVERTEGEQQVDYLRRLSADLKAREDELVGQEGKLRRHRRIGAIGILGDDYYDKLMTLKALRPRFPDAVFFTTDLDAAMLLPGDNEYTRNLVVASGYGLSLAPLLQEGFPSFRNVYQTSTFLAVQVALQKANAPESSAPSRDQIEKWLKPLIFEIGRSQAVLLPPIKNHTWRQALSPPTDPPGATTATQKNHNKLADCKNPHPDPISYPGYAGCLIPIGVLLPLWGLSWLCGFTRGRHNLYWFLTIIFSTMGALILIVLLKMGEEALDWFQGVSIWPSVLMRVLMIIVAVYLYFRGRRYLQETRARIDLEYFPGKTGPRKEFDQRLSAAESGQGSTLFQNFFGRGWVGRVFRRCVFKKPESGLMLMPEVLWRIYTRTHSANNEGCPPMSPKDKGSGKTGGEPLLSVPAFFGVPFHTLCFLFSLCFIFMVLFFNIFLNMPMPQSPARGEVAFYANTTAILLSVFSFFLLLFFAIYRGFIAVWLAEELQRTSGWPPNTFASLRPPGENKNTLGDNRVPTAFDRWLNARFIARVTEPVQHIIFYPFPVLALFILARTPIFAGRFYIPSALLTLFLIFFILVVIAALRLRNTSEKVRRKTLETLNDNILEAKIKGLQDFSAGWEAMRDQVLQLRTGAFAPFSEQPLVKALLTLVGSYSGLKLLEYANLANF